MRQAASLFRRNRFARLLAVAKCAELLLDDAYRETNGLLALRIESESTRLFDDLVEQRGAAHLQHGWQIKQQSTSLDAEIVSSLLRELCAQTSLTSGNLATSDSVAVAGGGHLRTLRDLCDRLSAPGAHINDVINGATKEEAAWLQLVENVTGTRHNAVATLSRLRIHVLGDEKALLDRARGYLPGLYKQPIQAVLTALESFVSSVDGTIEITAALLHERALQHLVLQQRRGAHAESRRARREQYLRAVLRRYQAARALDTISGSSLTTDASLSEVFVQRRLAKCDAEYRGLHEWLKIGTARYGFVIVGEVGSGKSALLQETEHRVAKEALGDERAPMPLLVRAHDLRALDTITQLSGFLGLHSDTLNSVLNEPLFTWYLLIDGTDEVPGNVWTYIERFVNQFSDTQQLACLVVATRPVRQPEHHSYERLTLEEWDAAALDEFLEHWKTQSPTAVSILTCSPYFESLKQTLLLNPLIATLCLFIAAENKTVPAERTRIFVEVSELLFEGWRRSRVSTPRIEWHELRTLLGKLALDALRTGDGIAPDDLRDSIRSALHGRVLEAADEAQRELGLLVPRPDGRYDFVLRSFGEHLAAAYLVRRWI